MQDSQQRAELTQQQRSRLALIESDLDTARNASLADETPAELIIRIEQLRSSLHDAVTLVREMSESADQRPAYCSGATSDHRP